MKRLYLTATKWTKVDFDIVSWHESNLLFTAKKGGVRARTQPVLSLVHHATTGETTPEQFYRNITSIKTKDKRGYSCHFYGLYDGRCYQMAPLNLVTRHAGLMNAVSVGTEFQNRLVPRPDIPLWERNFPRGSYLTTIHGRNRTLLMMPADQLEMAVALTDALCAALEIERRVPGTFGVPHTTVIADPKNYTGVLAHYHCTKTRFDPGTQLFDELVRDSYSCSMKKPKK